MGEKARLQEEVGKTKEFNGGCGRGGSLWLRSLKSLSVADSRPIYDHGYWHCGASLSPLMVVDEDSNRSAWRLVCLLLCPSDRPSLSGSPPTLFAQPYLAEVLATGAFIALYLADPPCSPPLSFNGLSFNGAASASRSLRMVMSHWSCALSAPRRRQPS